MHKKVIIISPKTNGGITAVVENLLKGNLCKNNNFFFHESTFESSGFRKIYLFIIQWLKAVVLFFNFKPELIHIHVSSKGSFYRKSCYVLLSRLYRKKIIIHIHPTHFVEFLNNSGRLKKAYILKILYMANLIITLTYEVAQHLKKIKAIAHKKYKILPNPICINLYKFCGASERDKSTLLYLGWIIKKKGVYDLLTAAEIVKEKVKTFRLVYCGNKETDKLRRMVHDSGADGYIEVNNWVDKETKQRMLNEFTALVLPTYTEGIPNVILEAMASGMPIITTPVGGIPTILKDNINCLFFEPGNREELANKIICLLKNRDLQEKISVNNIKCVENYDVKKIIAQLIEIYAEI